MVLQEGKSEVHPGKWVLSYLATMNEKHFMAIYLMNSCGDISVWNKA